MVIYVVILSHNIPLYAQLLFKHHPYRYNPKRHNIKNSAASTRASNNQFSLLRFTAVHRPLQNCVTWFSTFRIQSKPATFFTPSVHGLNAIEIDLNPERTPSTFQLKSLTFFMLRRKSRKLGVFLILTIACQR